MVGALQGSAPEGMFFFKQSIICQFHFADYDVKKISSNRALLGISMLAALALTGCGTPAAKDFGGSWKPLNRFQNAPTEIPLTQPYTFFAAPMDGTLRSMLLRWSKDSGMTLSYQLHSDFTLYTPVSEIHTSDIWAAAAQLSSIYASEGVSVTVAGQQIVVKRASVVAPATAEAAGAPKSSGASAGSKRPR